MKKRFFALALALLMLFGTAPVSTLADEGPAWIDEECPVAAAAGEVPALHDHGWTTIQNGDCTHDFITEIHCSKCGKSYTYHDPALGHEWDEGVVTKTATCTEDGEITYTCQRLKINTYCGEKKTETIPALKILPVEWTREFARIPNRGHRKCQDPEKWTVESKTDRIKTEHWRDQDGKIIHP